MTLGLLLTRPCSLSLSCDRLDSNVLACHVKACTANNFPLALKDVQLEVREAERNDAFLKGFWHKLEWSALVETARAVSCNQISPLRRTREGD